MAYKDVAALIEEGFWDTQDFDEIELPICDIEDCEETAAYETQSGGEGTNLCESHYYEFEELKD